MKITYFKCKFKHFSLVQSHFLVSKSIFKVKMCEFVDKVVFHGSTSQFSLQFFNLSESYITTDYKDSF